MTGFADLVPALRDASVRPARGDTRLGGGDTPPPAGDAFLARLNPAVRERALGRMRSRTTLLMSQEDIDDLDDDAKWQWAKDAINAEHTRAAEAAQATITEGPPHDTAHL